MRKVKLIDYEGYDSDTCRNGGNYGFTTVYSEVEPDIWEIEHYTTSDMDYCPVCGNFASHYLGDGAYSCGEFMRVSTKEMKADLERFKSDSKSENRWIEWL